MQSWFEWLQSDSFLAACHSNVCIGNSTGLVCSKML